MSGLKPRDFDPDPPISGAVPNEFVLDMNTALQWGRRDLLQLLPFLSFLYFLTTGKAYASSCCVVHGGWVHASHPAAPKGS